MLQIVTEVRSCEERSDELNNALPSSFLLSQRLTHYLRSPQLDGCDARGNIKVLMATNRPDTLDPALLRPGRLDRKVEFGLPDLEVRSSDERSDELGMR